MAEKDLDFKVILNDEQFDAQISKDIKLAEQFNIQLSALLDLKTKVGKTTMVGDSIKAERLQKATADAAAAQERLRTATINTATAQERNATAAANAANAQERLKMTQMRSEQLAKRIAEQTKKQNNAYLQQSRILNELKGVALGYLSIHGASQLLSSLVRVTGEFELQKTTLAAMIGDLNKAEGIITRIQGLAVESPFQFKELTTYAKQLSAFSVPAEELYNTTKMLADISAGLGVGMDRIVLAYGQVRSAAFLRGQEVRQFTEAGIPILDELAKQFSELEGRVVSTGEVFDKISARLVPFEMVAKVFKDMTSEGGKFFNMQEVQAETLKGKISNLKDAYEVMLNEIGKGQSENLKGAVDWARKLMTNYEETGKALVSLVAAYGVYRTTLAITTNLQSTLARNLVVLRREFRSLSAMLSVNPYALLAAGITAVGYGIYKASTSLKDYEKIQKSVEDTQQKYTENIALESTKLDALYAKLRVAKKGTEEYDKAKKNIYTQYASYISELKNEGVAVDNLATLYTNLKDKMVDAAKARYRMTAAQNVEQEYSQGIDNLLKRFNLLTENMGNSIKRELMEVEKEALWQYILGDENALNIPEAEGIRSVATSMLPSGYGYLVDQAKIDAKVIIDTYSKARERIDRLFGEESVESVIPPAAVETPIEDEAEKAVEAIKKEINALQTLKKEYEDWKALGVSDESIKLSLMGYFPNIKAEYGEDFITQLDYATRILEKIKELEKIAPDEAFNLMTSFGLDKASLDKQAVKEQQKAFEDSAKAAGRYFDVLRKWTAEDFNVNGEGIAFDVSKIASDLNEKIKEIELRSTKAKEIFDQIDVDSEQEVAKVKDIFVKEFGADAWEEFWQSYQSEGFKAIENLADKQKEYEKKVAQEKLTDVAKKFAKEKLEPLNLTDWGDKSLGQIKRIQESLKSLLVNPVVFPPEVQEQVDSLGLSMDDLYEIVKAIFGENYKDVLDEKLKKIQDRAKNAVTALGDIGGAFSNIGSAIGSEALENIGLYIDGVEEVISALVDCDYLWEEISKMMKKTSEASEEAADSIDDIASSTDWITVILKVVLVLAEQISNAVAIAEEGTWALRKAAMEYQEVLHEIALEQADTIWGENYTRKLKEGFDYVKTTYEAYHNYIKSLMQEDFGGVKQRSFNLNDNSWDWLVVKDFAGLVDMYELMDEAGNLDMDWIKGNLDALIKSTSYNGLKLKKYLEKDLEHLVELYDAYQKAYAEIKATIQEMLAETANDFADNMIDSFLRVGDAADDLGKVFENLGTTLIKTFMADFLIENVLSKYTNELTDLFEQKAMGLSLEDFNAKFADIAARINADVADLAPLFNDLLANAQSNGLLSTDVAKDTESLASGIKGVTEDTANLLASYLNAIRADVSYAKGQREQTNAYLQQILTQVVSLNAPSLVEYQQQIAANTFNTAIATQAILARLDSVITSEGGFDAIRTYS